MTISPELVERAIAEISKRRANYEYFFERLSSPEWIMPLRQRGLFDDPPALEIDDRGIRAPSWPPSQFLARAAARAPEQVLEVILSVDTHNERVHADFAEAAASMPAPLARQWVERELAWLRGRERLYFVLPRKLVEVLGKLAREGEIEVALALTEELFRPVPEEAEAVRRWDLKRATPRFSHWEYDQLLDRAVQSLLDAAPERTVDLLVRLLKRVIDLASSEDAEPGEDYSFVWRPRLADDERDDRDIPQSLVSALRDAAAAVRQRASVSDARLVELLDEGRTRAFHRIAAFALAKPPLADPSVAARVLVDRDSFFDPEPSPEYREFLETAFGQLDRPSQDALLGWIAEGPDLNEYRDRWLRRDGETPSDTDVEHHAAVWRIRRLRLIRDHLPEAWGQRYEDLVDRFGEWKFVTSFEVSTWFGPQSPVGLEELRLHSDEDLLSLLEGYEDSSRWFGPSREGLARTLSALAEEDPERISRLARRLVGLRPVHVQWALIGLAKAVRDGKPVAWPSLVELLNGVVHVRDEDEQTEDEDNYGRWVWVRQEVASILDAGFQSMAFPVPFDLRRSTWRILEALTDDPEPTPEYEERYGGSNMDPATLALNTIRGRAMHAVVAYALWTRRAIEGERGESAVQAGFAAMPEVREVLDRHLDLARDPSIAVRAVYGQRFPWLALVDEVWAASASQLIFPEDPDLRGLRHAAWQSYIIFCRPYDQVFRILRSQYSKAVEQLHDVRPPWRWIGGNETPEQQLAGHLLTFYWRGTLGLHESDELLVHFFTNAAPDARAFAVEFLGRAIRETKRLDGDARERLERFWEWRIQEAERDRRKDQQTEIAAFAWWADADVLGPEWRLTQLERVLRLGGSLEPESVAYAALEKLAHLHPLRSVRLLRIFLDREKEGWTIDGGRDEIERILRAGLESKNPEARGVAEDVVHWLGSIGYRGFRDLLRGNRS